MEKVKVYMLMKHVEIITIVPTMSKLASWVQSVPLEPTMTESKGYGENIAQQVTRVIVNVSSFPIFHAVSNYNHLVSFIPEYANLDYLD